MGYERGLDCCDGCESDRRLHLLLGWSLHFQKSVNRKMGDYEERPMSRLRQDRLCQTISHSSRWLRSNERQKSRISLPRLFGQKIETASSRKKNHSLITNNENWKLIIENCFPPKSVRVSYNGYYATLPRLRRGFDSRYPLHNKNTTFVVFLLWICSTGIESRNRDGGEAGS